MSLLLLLTAGCATLVPTETADEEPAKVEDRVVVDGAVLPLPDEPEIRARSIPGSQASSPVVANLLAKADGQQRSGQLDAAANSLERALRIEPRNAHLWFRLAEIRYQQGHWQQAAQMSAKSNTLVNDDHQLRRRNWYLMANAYNALGDHAKANHYRAKLQ
ncbi:MAG: tetratricopeptide repeat protein [Gammaproteobacteria bacterium]|nr:tetratricopeptide repeat protein [Gammaproteobacteria bacterium]